LSQTIKAIFQKIDFAALFQISTGFDKKPVDLFYGFRSGGKENVRNPQKSALQMVKMQNITKPLESYWFPVLQWKPI